MFQNQDSPGSKFVRKGARPPGLLCAVLRGRGVTASDVAARRAATQLQPPPRSIACQALHAPVATRPRSGINTGDLLVSHGLRLPREASSDAVSALGAEVERVERSFRVIGADQARRPWKQLGRAASTTSLGTRICAVTFPLRDAGGACFHGRPPALPRACARGRHRLGQDAELRQRGRQVRISRCTMWASGRMRLVSTSHW